MHINYNQVEIICGFENHLLAQYGGSVFILGLLGGNFPPPKIKSQTHPLKLKVIATLLNDTKMVLDSISVCIICKNFPG